MALLCDDPLTTSASVSNPPLSSATMRKASCNLLARLLVVVCVTGEEVDDGSSSSSCCRRSLAPRDGREFIPPPPSAMVVRLPPPLNHLPAPSFVTETLSLSLLCFGLEHILKWVGQDDGKVTCLNAKLSTTENAPEISIYSSVDRIFCPCTFEK